MTSGKPDHHPHPSTTAVVQIAGDGTATLYLGTKPVEHAAAADAVGVMRVLLDYTATLDTPMTVTTQMPDGQWTRHRLDPGGTITAVPRNAPPLRPASDHITPTSPRTSQHAKRSSTTARIAARAPIIAVLLFLVVALLAAMTAR
jgi:hypothetical protein